MFPARPSGCLGHSRTGNDQTRDLDDFHFDGTPIERGRPALP
jgi:hypothetical protein